jgi:DNA-binding transcriptional MerR regulator
MFATELLMVHATRFIPEKIFFKIGEVCELVGVQAHVLRYWETEFPMLSPQKNRSGQRTYRRRDVEVALRIKELLYDELFTIAGARKKLQVELRETARSKHPATESEQSGTKREPIQNELPLGNDLLRSGSGKGRRTKRIPSEIKLDPNDDRSEALKKIASELLEIRDVLRTSKND